MFKTVWFIFLLIVIFRYVLVRVSNDIIEQEDYIDKELRELEERYK